MSVNHHQKITVLGAGAWGTAIAATVARVQGENAQGKILLWGRDKNAVDSINQQHQHPDKLGTILLPKNLQATNDINIAVADADIIFLVIPTQKMRGFLQDLPKISAKAILVSCAKGLEQEKLQLPHQIIKTHCDNICLSLSGPNFASEIAANKPATTIIAGDNESAIESVMQSLNHEKFRPYYHFDQIGLEAAAIMKNVVAIACGIIAALELGDNARAALITRSITEMARFVETFGGKRETIYGLGGIGDLMLTCGSRKSRNMSFGYDYAKGLIDMQEFLKGESKNIVAKNTIEGAFSAKAIHQLCPDLDLPICHAIYRLLYQNADINTIISGFFSRPLKPE
ncbi:MAG: NAD(P)-dependent glycerol-3-phosphate dehydrogenase [Alphaproteobacteria bacterium]|nr:NAD(P)-dependent glycerol-3-phosphate dehydrogenase [Alphaproteobacteria bacterium]